MNLETPEIWPILRAIFGAAGCIAIGLVSLWARKALVADGMSTISVGKRLAAACGIITSSLPSAAIRRLRLRLACVLLVLCGHVIGGWWFERRTDRAISEWLDSVRRTGNK